jgi:hypothetical protein
VPILDPVPALVLLGVIKVEYLLGAVAVVGVEMREGHNVDLVLVAKPIPQLLLEGAAPVVGVVPVAHVGEVKRANGEPFGAGRPERQSSAFRP